MKKLSVIEKSIFISYLRKIGYQSRRKLCKNNKIFEKLLIKAFQRRFRPEQINGKIDQECLIIIKNLINTYI